LPLARLASLVKFEHTVFALPFAFMSAIVAAGGIPASRIVLLILAAMVGARTAAMTFNRIADVEFDRANPRTAKRELVTGAVSTAQAWALLLASCALFLWAAWQINRLALMLAPVALAIVLGYSYTKRFTVLSHAILGLALAIAPVGAWVAVRAEIGFPSLILAASVLAWTAGFDIIYSLQDTGFDKEHGLFSLPASIGEANALAVSRVLHALMVALLVWFGKAANLGLIYMFAVFLVALFLVWEHSLVSPRDKSRVNTAFFTLNGIVSVSLFVLTLVDVLVIL
jgi:4-hydroxybenzoate polyprenyltransferase